MMKKRLACLLPALALLAISSVALHADQFSNLANSPGIYWVPAPTPPPPGYVAGPPPAYYGPAPYYYYGPPPPPRVVVTGPRFFFGFHFH